MNIHKLSLFLFVTLCCLFINSPAQAQQAYGYASITFDENANIATGYASTELDYETAYYYDAEVQAHIEDENGNVLGSGSAIGNPSAFTVFDVFQALLCIRLSIISFVITAPHFLGCDSQQYFDVFGFSDYWWGWYWDFGDFFISRRNRCIFGRLIFIATIISDFIRCLPADVACRKIPDTNQLLPSGLRQNIETQYLTGLVPNVNNSDRVTITCRATDAVTGNPQSGLLVRFGFDNVFATDGGHQNHVGARPQGSYSHAAVRTDGNGEASSVYTAPIFGGTVRLRITAPDAEGGAADMEIKVPALASLAAPAPTDGYVLTGSAEDGNTHHPNGHFGTAASNTGLREIATEYRTTAFPQNQFPNGQPNDRRLRYNDQSLIWGGKFDITPNFRVGAPPSWRAGGSHDEHRVGINCDVGTNTVPDENVVINGQTLRRRAVLESIFFNRGSTDTLREFAANHWHLRFEFNNPAAVAVNGSVPADEVATAVPGVIEAERYDNTGNQGTAGSFVPDDGSMSDPNFPGIIYSKPQVLPVTGNEEQSYVPTAGGQWMNYTVNVASTGSYTFETRVASWSSWNTFHVEVDGVDRTGPIYIPNTGSGDVYQFVTVNDIWLDAGQRVIRVVIDGSGSGKGNFDYFTINPYFPPQFCNPEWWEIQDCQNAGGSWDYGSCACNYWCLSGGICQMY